MALVLIEKTNKYEKWSGNNLAEKKIGKFYSVKSFAGIYILSQKDFSLDAPEFWNTIAAEISDDKISIFIHFGGGATGVENRKDNLPTIEEINTILTTDNLNNRITVSSYSLGQDNPKGIRDIIDACDSSKEFESEKLLNIFGLKKAAEEKTIVEQNIENKQSYITALLLLLKVNHTSLKASSTLLANLKDGLSQMENTGIDTSGLITSLEKMSSSDMLSAADIKQMENDCRKALKILKNERQSLGSEYQNIS